MRSDNFFFIKIVQRAYTTEKCYVLTAYYLKKKFFVLFFSNKKKIKKNDIYFIQ